MELQLVAASAADVARTASTASAAGGRDRQKARLMVSHGRALGPNSFINRSANTIALGHALRCCGPQSKITQLVD